MTGDAQRTVLIACCAEMGSADVLVTDRPHAFISHQLVPRTIYLCDTPDPEILARRAHRVTILGRPFSAHALVESVAAACSVAPQPLLTPEPPARPAPVHSVELLRLAERCEGVRQQTTAVMRKFQAARAGQRQLRTRISLNR